jgi:hypothetical protein
MQLYDKHVSLKFPAINYLTASLPNEWNFCVGSNNIQEDVFRENTGCDPLCQRFPDTRTRPTLYSCLRAKA